jgi:hypothetical protein
LSPRPHPSPNTPSNNRRRTHSAAEMQHKRSEECLCRLPLRQKVSGREKLQRFLKNPFLEITSQADDPGKNSAGEKKNPTILLQSVGQQSGLFERSCRAVKEQVLLLCLTFF